MDPCPVCETPAKPIPLGRTDAIGFDCPRCGKYSFVVGSFAASLKTIFRDAHTRKAASAWIRAENDIGGTPNLDANTLSQLVARSEPGWIQRSRWLLSQVAKLTSAYGQHLRLDDKPSLIAQTWSNDFQDVQALAMLLTAQELFERSEAVFKLSAKGVTEVEKEHNTINSSQVFVAMSFSQDKKYIYDDGLFPGIIKAGYTPFRIDLYHHTNRIDEEIIAQIRKSRFLVADFTGQKQGVYFEAGFALGLGQQVIWSCHEDHLRDLHFDVRQFNCINWNDPTELARRLQTRIEAILGVGPNAKNS
jgi:hypothetical protein